MTTLSEFNQIIYSLEDNFEIFTRKLYPNKQLRNDIKCGVAIIVATEKLISAKKQYLDVEKKVQKHFNNHHGNFPGHFLIPWNDRLEAQLQRLINFTFGEL